MTSKNISTHLNHENNQKKLINVRYLEDNKLELYKSFPFNNELSLSTFYKYSNKSGHYKNPHRFTDFCEYSEWAKKAKKEFNKIFKKENLENQTLKLLSVLSKIFALSKEIKTFILLFLFLRQAIYYNFILIHFIFPTVKIKKF